MTYNKVDCRSHCPEGRHDLKYHKYMWEKSHRLHTPGYAEKHARYNREWSAKKRADLKLTCKALMCNNVRLSGRQYCNRCRKAYRQMTQMDYRRRKSEGSHLRRP